MGGAVMCSTALLMSEVSSSVVGAIRECGRDEAAPCSQKRLTFSLNVKKQYLVIILSNCYRGIERILAGCWAKKQKNKTKKKPQRHLCGSWVKIVALMMS